MMRASRPGARSATVLTPFGRGRPSDPARLVCGRISSMPANCSGEGMNGTRARDGLVHTLDWSCNPVCPTNR